MNRSKQALDAAQRRALRAQMLERARHLGDEVRQASADFAGTPGPCRGDVGDVLDQGEQLTHDTIRHAEQDRDAAELAEIDGALARMDGGRYGLCADCDAAIPLARLWVRPSAERCVACQQTHEQQHPAALREPLAR